MSTVRKLNESALRGIYDAYMHEAFPPAELKPLAVMLRLMERGRYLCYGYYRNGRLAAYAFFYRHDSRVLLLETFAVTPELRGRGVGSAFLAALDAVLGGVCILGEVEMPDSHDAGLNAMRLRRIAFYERAGFSLTGAACRLYGVRYAIIARRLPAGLTAAGLRGLLREVYRGLVPRLCAPLYFIWNNAPPFSRAKQTRAARRSARAARVCSFHSVLRDNVTPHGLCRAGRFPCV